MQATPYQREPAFSEELKGIAALLAIALVVFFLFALAPLPTIAALLLGVVVVRLLILRADTRR